MKTLTPYTVFDDNGSLIAEIKPPFWVVASVWLYIRAKIAYFKVRPSAFSDDSVHEIASRITDFVFRHSQVTLVLR